MAAVQLTRTQVVTIAVWSCTGADMAPVKLVFDHPGFVNHWENSDVLATQGDAHLGQAQEPEARQTPGAQEPRAAGAATGSRSAF